MDGPRPAAKHDSERTARCDHWSATRHGPEPSSKSGSEPAREHGRSPPQRVTKSAPQGSAHKVSAWGLPHQLRRRITGAVLAFGFNQGLFLRRQYPLRVLAPCRISAARHVDRAFWRAYFSMAKFHSKIAKKSIGWHVFFFFEDWRDRRVLTTFRTAMRCLV